MDSNQRTAVFEYVYQKADAIGYMGLDSSESKKFQDELEADTVLMGLAGERLQRMYIKDTIINRYSKLQRYINSSDVLGAIDGISEANIIGTKDELENGIFKININDIEIPCTSASFSEWQTVLKRFGAVEQGSLRFAFITCGGIRKKTDEIEEVKKILNSYGVVPFIVKPNSEKENISNFIGNIQKTNDVKLNVALSEIVDYFVCDAQRASFRVKKSDVHRFIASLLSKRFLISTGLAGSGKTKLAQIFAAWIMPNFVSEDIAHQQQIRNYEIVSVGADWSGSENILGYPNGLDHSAYVSKPALDLILRAHTNPHLPHFLILDEMNLSHVERYFADVLSVIESGERIHLHKDSERKANGVHVPQEIGLPTNLFIIGTVNVDETTYMFSPKVLDRANVIEFRMDQSDLAAFLASPVKPDLQMMASGGEGFGVNFNASSSGDFSPFIGDLKSRYELEMMLFFRVMNTCGAEYGYRVAHEAARFVQAFKVLGGHEDSDLSWFNEAFDYVVAQKFLPKLHGSRAKLGPLLRKLWFLCITNQERSGDALIEASELAAMSPDKQFEPSSVIPLDASFKVSAEKISRMWRLLNENGFASFAEA